MLSFSILVWRRVCVRTEQAHCRTRTEDRWPEALTYRYETSGIDKVGLSLDVVIRIKTSRSHVFPGGHLRLIHALTNTSWNADATEILIWNSKWQNWVTCLFNYKNNSNSKKNWPGSARFILPSKETSIRIKSPTTWHLPGTWKGRGLQSTCLQSTFYKPIIGDRGGEEGQEVHRKYKTFYTFRISPPGHLCPVESWMRRNNFLAHIWANMADSTSLHLLNLVWFGKYAASWNCARQLLL